MVSYVFEWDFKSSQEYEIIKDILIKGDVLTKDMKIKNEESFLDFGLFSFLNYILYHQKNYYDKNKMEKALTFIDISLLGLKIKVHYLYTNRMINF